MSESDRDDLLPQNEEIFGAVVDGLEISKFAVGGEGLARGEDGRVVFVAGAIPGERVSAELLQIRKDFARAQLVEVIRPVPQRVSPTCSYVGKGCGGCDWQHVDALAQPSFKMSIVADALRRIAGSDHVKISTGNVLAARGYRTTVRLGRAGAGAFGFRKAQSHDVVPVAHCEVVHPLLDELIHDSDFGSADEVMLRCGARTGERMILASPTAEGVRAPMDVVVVGHDELKAGRRAWIHEVVDSRSWRISARSFFQDRPDGAEALIDVLRPWVGSRPSGAAGGGRLIDLYGGVGLFAGTMDAEWTTELVEWSSSSVADARVNLADRRARIHRLNVTNWRPSRADVVVADPPRKGLGTHGAKVVSMTQADRLVLVSCDPAALARDTALLKAVGYELEQAVVIDLFPQTSHIETAALFNKS